MLKALKWILMGVTLAMLTVVGVTGSLADDSADGKHLAIVQSEMERSEGGLRQLVEERPLFPVTEAELRSESVLLQQDFSVTDKKGNTVNAKLSAQASLYTNQNALDHIVTVTNTGNVDGYVRTWFAFEQGDLTEAEFKEAIMLNRNTTGWVWESVTYGVEIDGQRYAVVCARYDSVLAPMKTTAPGLLQILLSGKVTGDIARRLDGNCDGKYEVRAHSQVVSDQGAWSAVSCPWLTA